jgi:hypothetical protein
MPEEQNERSEVQSIRAADFKADLVDRIATTTRTYPVRLPEKDKNDFLVQVWASTLHRCRHKLLKVKQSRFPYGEVLLAVSTLFLGSILGAWQAGIKMTDSSGIFFYVLSPVVAVGTVVAYFFYRHISISEPRKIVDEVLEELPNPDDTSETGVRN